MDYAFLFFLLASGWGILPEQGSQSVVSSTTTSSIRLDQVSRSEIADVPEPLLATPIFCAGNSVVFVRLANEAGITSLASISNGGKRVIRFDPRKVSDVEGVDLRKFFATDNELYVLARARARKNEVRTLRRPDGKLETQPGYSMQDYIVRFRHDGSYVGAIPLDAPFDPLQIGVFPDGSFLIAGSAQGRPRVALVKPTGQLLRFIELEGDIHARTGGDDKDDKNDAAALPEVAKQFDDSLFAAVQDSETVAHGRNLLLVRSGQTAPVFSISPGGEVKAVKPDLPQGFRLWDLKTDGRRWIALCTQKISDRAGVDLAIYGIDPSDGSILEHYDYPKAYGFGLACAGDSEFLVLTREDDKLQLIALTPR